MKSIFVIVFCFATVLCSENSTEVSENDEADILAYELFDAIRYANMSQVQSLIDRGVDVSWHRGVFSWSPLHAAVINDNFNEKILKVLIENGADLDVTDKFGATPLYAAVDQMPGNTKAVEILLKHGGNPNAQNEKLNKSVLHEAFLNSAFIQSSEEEIIDLLIEHGADVNEPYVGLMGMSPLHLAIYGGHKKAIELLIEKGANANAVVSRWNTTPLHYIAIYDTARNNRKNWTEDDSLKYAELLIDHGADVYAKAARFEGHEGTALDMASSKKLRTFLGSKMGFMGWLRTIW